MNDASATERLYFRDSKVHAFTGRILETRAVAEGRAGASCVRLDRTAFYPEGGGQPCDFGILAGARVLDVVEDEHGGIWHTLERAVGEAGREVEGEVDAIRRFDHMQQHSGQHLLSRVFVEQLGLDTSSFHLGVEACSIDLGAANLDPRQIENAEELAARIVREARPVLVRIGAEAEALASRGDGRPDPQYRVVSITGFDDCACGGTHVENTAQIESIVIRRVERINDSRCRVEFQCGGRARRDHRGKRERMRELCRVFSAEEPRLLDAARAVLEKQKDAEKRARDLEREVLPFRVDAILRDAREERGLRYVALELSAAARSQAQPLAQELAKRDRVVAAIVVAGDPGGKAQLFCACGPGSGIKASEWMTTVLADTGGRGGGSPHLAQGGFPSERHAEVASILKRGITGG